MISLHLSGLEVYKEPLSLYSVAILLINVNVIN